MNAQQIVPIEYAHCIRWTKGQLDCAPFSSYEKRTACATLSIIRYEETADYLVTLDGNKIGDGDSENDAIAQAQWWLMNASRNAARAESEAR